MARWLYRRQHDLPHARRRVCSLQDTLACCDMDSIPLECCMSPGDDLQLSRRKCQTCMLDKGKLFHAADAGAQHCPN